MNNDDIHEAMRFFLKHMPDNLTLARPAAAPPLGTANLRSRLNDRTGQWLLAFDTEETTRFNQRVADGIDDTTADSICSYVEGWPLRCNLSPFKHSTKRTLAQSAESFSHLQPCSFVGLPGLKKFLRLVRQRNPPVLDAMLCTWPL